MIKFEKVSYKQFKEDSAKLGYKPLTEEEFNSLELPKRSSSGSAGYDFISPYSFTLSEKRDLVTIPLGFKAIMPKNVVLIIVPRSGSGFKTGCRLANSVGVIDSDYSQSSNEGHIMLKLYKPHHNTQLLSLACLSDIKQNGGLQESFKDFNVKSGDRVCQGIFINYLLTDHDKVTKKRDGGFGSSGE